MTAFIGLTKTFQTKYNNLVAILLELDIHTIEKAKEVCNEEEIARLRIVANLTEHPYLNLRNCQPGQLI